MHLEELKKYIDSKDFLKKLNEVNSPNNIYEEKNRYENLLNEVRNEFGDGDYSVISSPGRIEIIGNHTDHQKGKVFAAAINIDNICFVKKNDSNYVIVKDKLFNIEKIDINDIEMKDNEKNKSESIIRGVVSYLKKNGYKVGGFSCYSDTKVLIGSGISSSACFELMIIEIFNVLYNDSKIDSVEKAKIAKYAENEYFGKPCGLMDQLAISSGGFTAIDFKNIDNVKIDKYNFSFEEYGYAFLIVNTKAYHEDLTYEYASIPNEMKLVANYFGKNYLSEVDENEFYLNISKLREVIKNDRAILRAIHYFEENKKVIKLCEGIKNKNIKVILDMINESGNSSFMYLQNIYTNKFYMSQPISLALALSKNFLQGENCGVCRVQGGGFAGTIEVILKKEFVNEYIEEIEKAFGKDVVCEAKIRNYGAMKLV